MKAEDAEVISHTYVHLPTNTFDSPDKPFFELILHRYSLSIWHLLGWGLCNYVRVLGAGEEVDQVDDPFIVYISRLQNVCGREVLLLGGKLDVLGRADAKMAALFGVEEAAEERWRVELGPRREHSVTGRVVEATLRGERALVVVSPEEGIQSLPAHKVQAAVQAHQGTGPHVPNEAIVLDGYVACEGTVNTWTMPEWAPTHLWLCVVRFLCCPRRERLRWSWCRSIQGS